MSALPESSLIQGLEDLNRNLVIFGFVSSILTYFFYVFTNSHERTKYAFFSLIWLIWLATGCASSNKNTLTAVGLGTAVGGIYGMSRPEYQNQNALMYGAIGGLVAGATALALDVDKNNQSEIRAENEKLKIKLNEFQSRSEPKLINQGSGLFQSPLPNEVANLVEPGEWKRFKMDQWVQDPNNSNTWYRQVEMFEITPPVAR